MHTIQLCKISKMKIFLFSLFVFGCVHTVAEPLHAKLWGDFHAKAVKTAIEDIAKHRNSEKRIEAAKLLGSYDTPESIAALGAALVSDIEPKVREQAASSLWKHMKKGKAAQQDLFKALNDSSPTVRIRASWALTAQGVDSKELVESRRSVLTDTGTTYSNRFWAAKGLIDFEPPENVVIPILEYARGRLESKAAKSALKKLARKQDRGIIEPMREMVKEYNKGNGLILEGMAEYSPPVEDMVQLLCRQFSFGDNKLTEIVLNLLKNHANKAEEVSYWLPLVKPYTKSPHYSLRYQSVNLIGSAEGLAYDALPELLYVIQHDSESSIREYAVRAIGSMGDKTKPYSEEIKTGVGIKAVPLLSKLVLNDPDKDIRKIAVRTLPQLKADPAKVVPVYVQTALKNDEDVLVRMSALKALNALGSNAKAALPDIKKLLDHSDSAISDNAKWAIKAIEKGDVPVDKDLPVKAVKTGAQSEKAMALLREKSATFDERGFAMALQNFDLEKVKAYLDSGVPVNHRFTSLHDRPVLNTVFDTTTVFAMQKKPTPKKVKELVKFLLERGANPNITDKSGNTALMMAAMGCDEELLQILIDGGADVHAEHPNGLIALEFSFSFANKGAYALIKAGSRLSPEKVETYKKYYGDRPEVIEMVEKAAEK